MYQIGKTSMANRDMGIQGALNPFLYGHRNLKNLRVTVRVVDGIIVFWKQSNIMNDAMHRTIINIKDARHQGRETHGNVTCREKPK
jgi:hypothetical protein